MYCRICGDERKTSYRQRSSMVLCPACHAETPAKVGFEAFLNATFRKDNPAFPEDYGDRAIAREFYSDYRASTIGCPHKYWRQCSAQTEV